MLLTLLEVAFLAAAVVGIGLWSVPAALVAGGVIGALACEAIERRRRTAAPPAEPRP